jgi:hypothetical protein
MNRADFFKNGIFIESFTSSENLLSLARQLIPRKSEHALIRVGPQTDGGYLLPDDLEDIHFCFSPGVADTAEFERGLLHYGIKSHLADLTVDSVPGNVEVASFTKKFISAITTENYITIDDWLNQSVSQEHKNDLILQMDIEGFEYLSLLATSQETLKRFRIIVLELHSVDTWALRDFNIVADALLSKLHQHFVLVHNHPNNAAGVVSFRDFQIPRVMELTFLRKDRIRHLGTPSILPHPLDCPNDPSLPKIALPLEWLELV